MTRASEETPRDVRRYDQVCEGQQPSASIAVRFVGSAGAPITPDFGFSMPQRLDETRRLGNGGTEPSHGAPYEGGQSLVVGRAFIGAVRAGLATLLHHMGCAFRSGGKGVQRPTPARGRRCRGAVVRVVAGLARVIVIVAVLGSLAAAGAMLCALHDFPSEKPVGGNNESSLILQAANGETVGRVGPLKLADAARTDLFVSIEDRQFFDHPGFDPRGILRVIQRNIALGTIVQGASTITQQLVKMRFLGHERTLLHKLREALPAVWLDVQLGKEEILTLQRLSWERRLQTFSCHRPRRRGLDIAGYLRGGEGTARLARRNLAPRSRDA
jgi:hypothetical protein